MPDWGARILRTIIQLIASGALTALVEQIARDVPSNWTPYILMIWMVIVTAAQNGIEQATGKSFLKPPTAMVAEAKIL
jgi:hypothetical protein